MFSWLNPLNAIVDGISKAYIARQNATTDQERIAADTQIKTLEARRDVLVSEAGSRVNTWIRASFAAPFIAFNAKVIVWDKMLGLGSTPEISERLFYVEMACISFYFLYDITARLKGK